MPISLNGGDGSSDLPMIDAVLVEVPNPGHPCGAKGVGEVNIVPPNDGDRQRDRQRDPPPPDRTADVAAQDPRRPRHGPGGRLAQGSNADTAVALTRLPPDYHPGVGTLSRNAGEGCLAAGVKSLARTAGEGDTPPPIPSPARGGGLGWGLGG
jgi:hypothetical protein